MTDKERLEEIIDAIAYLRDEYVDTEMVSEYYGHDIKAEIFSCPISALSYTGDYIELLQKRVQELESFIDRFINSLSSNCLKEHVRKYRTDKKLMRTIRRQNEPPSYLSTSDKFALISLTKLFENVAEQNKRYREALKFYAEESNYDYDVKVDVKVDGIGDDWTYKRIYTVGSKILDDGGEKARKALEGEE